MNAGGPVPELADLVGDWRIARRIDDRRTGQIVTGDGAARLSDAGGGRFAWCERLLLDWPGQAPLEARRRDLWQATPSGFDVAFGDGRPFHSVTLGHPICDAVHDCPPDFYRVRYDFSRWPMWRVTWRVVGPRKDYLMRSDYAAPAK
ncbi:MAG: DUF6314 family protein [Rhodobacteraceae bacterium]|nr:DUF6314 family protein [Paracoccaceae bacterium]